MYELLRQAHALFSARHPIDYDRFTQLFRVRNRNVIGRRHAEDVEIVIDPTCRTVTYDDFPNDALTFRVA